MARGSRHGRGRDKPGPKDWTYPGSTTLGRFLSGPERFRANWEETGDTIPAARIGGSPRPKANRKRVNRTARSQKHRINITSGAGVFIPELYGLSSPKSHMFAVGMDGPDLIFGLWYGFGEIEEFTEILINDAAIPAAITVEEHKGASNQTVSTILSNLSGYTHTLVIDVNGTDRGMAYLAFRCPPGAVNGFPKVAVKIKGNCEIEDTRTATTAYSDVPALCWRHWLKTIGAGPEYSVHDGSFELLADFNEEVPGDPWLGSHNYSLLDFAKPTGANPLSRIYEVTTDNGSSGAVEPSWNTALGATTVDVGLLWICRDGRRHVCGFPTDVQADISSWMETWRTLCGAMYTFGELGIEAIPDTLRATDHVFKYEDSQIKNNLALKQTRLKDRPNAIQITYTNIQCTPWRDATVRVAIAGVNAGTIQERLSCLNLPGIQRKGQAIRLATERLNASNLTDLSFPLHVFDEGLKVKAGDVVEVTDPIGLVAKKMRVLDARTNEPGRWFLDLWEYDPAVYSDYVETESTYPDFALNTGVEIYFAQLSAECQAQIDGKIDSWFQVGDPQLTWSGTDASHEGDMWWNTTTKKLKRWSGVAWSADIEDQKAIDAYADAATAQDTADGKRRVFTTTPTTPYDIGDLWAAGSDGDIMRCSTARASGAYQSGDWELASNYDETATHTAQNLQYNGDFELDVSTETNPKYWDRSVNGTPLFAIVWATTPEAYWPPWKPEGHVFYANCDNATEYVKLESNYYIPITQDSHYCLSCWIKTSNSKSYLGVEWFDKNYNSLSIDFVCLNAYQATHAWEQKSSDAFKPSDYEPTARYVKIISYPQYQRIGYGLISRIQFVESKTPVAWEVSYATAPGSDATATSDFVTTTYPADQSDLQDQIDDKIVSWFQSSNPQPGWAGSNASHAGDMWWNTSTKQLKRWSGSAWSSVIEDQKAIDAYADAATAQDTADGKRRVFTATPTTPYDVGDLWSAGPSGDIKKCKTARASGAYQAGDWELASEYDATDYTDPDIANALSDNDVLTISRPVGASYSGASVQNGAIGIILPQSWTNTMMQFVIDVFQYTTGKSFTLHVSGYNAVSSGGEWRNATANLTGSIAADNRVRFGHGNSKCCVMIGDTSASWSHLKVTVRDFQAGYLNYSKNQWDDGWAVALYTSTSSFIFSEDFSDALIDARDAAQYTGSSIATGYTDAKCTDASADETAIHEAFNTNHLDGSKNYSGDAAVDIYEDLRMQSGCDISFHSGGSYKGGIYGVSGGMTINTSAMLTLAGQTVKLQSINDIQLTASIKGTSGCTAGTSSSPFSKVYSSAFYGSGNAQGITQSENNVDGFHVVITDGLITSFTKTA